MSDETLIRVDGVSKKFCRSLKKSLWYGMQDLGNEIRGRRHGGNGTLRPDEFWAVKDVSFELKRGECLGLIGRNGAGKTSLLRLLNGLIKPDVGRIEMRGRIGALIALGAGFNPILTGRENIYVNASVLGLSKHEIKSKIDEIIDFAEIGQFIDMPVKSYSSGMAVRLGFAVASALEPDILLLDEVLAVGDIGFRTKCYNRIHSLASRTAVIFVSHSMSQISRLSTKAIVMSSGRIAFSGDMVPAVDAYNALFAEGRRADWHFASGVNVDYVRINGQQDQESISFLAGEPFAVEIQISLPAAITAIEAHVSILEPSGDLVAGINSALAGPPLAIRVPAEPVRLLIYLPSLTLGTGAKLLSLIVKDARSKLVIMRAHTAWTLNVTGPSYVSAPVYFPASFELNEDLSC